MKSILLSIFIFICVISYGQKKHTIFNGKDLNDWVIIVGDSTVNPEEYFYVKNGMIETVGVPAGYIRTKKEFTDYHLHVEWRYPENPTNSGVMIHVNGPDKIWVSHYQAQLKVLNAGDFIVHGVGERATINDSTYVSTETVKPVVPKLHPTNEKPASEWNSYDIYCNGNKIELNVNGLLQNAATNCSLTKGAIGLQAEGSKIQFRNLWIEKIK
ncbi:MAG: DUF1080 domain-containing protein [Prolixibacteraceae bacterium]